MISLSQTTGYAIKALACLSEPGCERRSTPVIAECVQIPRPYLAKIFSVLVAHGLVKARRGVGGGVSLARRPEEITLLEILEAVEGKDWLGDCLLGLDECTDLITCPTHDFWQRIRREIRAELTKTTLATVIAFKAQACARPLPGQTPVKRSTASRRKSTP